MHIYKYTCACTGASEELWVISPWISHVPVSSCGLKPPGAGVMGRSSGACQCPCLSQQHVPCLAGDSPWCSAVLRGRSPRGVTPLSGTLEIPDRSAAVCEFTSLLLQPGLGFQLMTQRYTGSMHWWSGVLSHCTSLVVLFFFFPPPPSITYCL